MGSCIYATFIFIALFSSSYTENLDYPINNFDEPSIIAPTIDDNFADWTQPLSEHDTPLYWHIPKTAGTTLEYIYYECFDLIEASEVGVLEGHDRDTTIQVVTLNSNIKRAVNVDTTTTQGIQRAKQLGLAQSGLADVIFTHHFHEISLLFDTQYRGRMFAIFRHPVDRAVSLYHYLKNADWEHTFDAELAGMTIEEYANSPKAERDWMTRMLVNKMEGPLEDEDLLQAKEILRRKCVVGLITELESSLGRFEQFFSWQSRSSYNSIKCKQRFLKHGVNHNPHPLLEEGSEAWELFMRNNRHDVQLYEYVVKLYEIQGYWFSLTAGDRC